MENQHNRNFILKTVGQELELNNINYSIITASNQIDTDKIDLGIVTGFAVWSGYSISYGYKLIQEVSKQIDNERDWFEWIFIDSDAMNDEAYKDLFGVNKWGYSESVFIQNGDKLKCYNSPSSYNDFLVFFKNNMSLRLIQLNKKKSQTYDLNTEEINFGISNEHFISDNRAIVSANSKYKGEFIFKLMKYDSNGHWYVFEDELLTIYDPTRPSPLSSCFIDLKRIRESE